VFANLPKKVKIVEVGMRDGLQNEPEFIPAAGKIKLVDLLSRTGLTHLEVTSFVSPKWIPQLKDNREVLGGAAMRPEIAYTALVPNRTGLEAAKETGLKEVAFFLSASESHSMKNINKPIAGAMEVAGEVIQEALSSGIKVRTILSTVFGCPFDGPTDVEKVLDISKGLLEMGAYSVALADTTGMANPKQVAQVIDFVGREIELKYLGVHFHDTRGCGLANAMAALVSGITSFDSSFGGLGGCPFAPGASGNIATEDLVYMFHSMGVDTGVDLARLTACSSYAQQLLGRELPSKYLKTIISSCDDQQQ
jgi:hydroxymethylglutaryl-CoA lyase